MCIDCNDPNLTFYFMKTTHSYSLAPQSPRLSRSGFTLLEMVIVLGIIALIMGGVMVTLKKIGAVGNVNRVEGDFQGLESALMGYKTLAGHFPSQQQGLKALVEKPTQEPRPRRWKQLQSKLQLDPWGNEYVYKYPGTKDASRPEIISKGDDGVEGTDDDMSSQDE